MHNVELTSNALRISYRVFTRSSKLRAHVAHLYFQYICSMIASSCKHPIIQLFTLFYCGLYYLGFYCIAFFAKNNTKQYVQEKTSHSRICKILNRLL